MPVAARGRKQQEYALDLSKIYQISKFGQAARYCGHNANMDNKKSECLRIRTFWGGDCYNSSGRAADETSGEANSPSR